jgi:hypothetical protein
MSRRATLFLFAVILFSLSCSLFSASNAIHTAGIETSSMNGAANTANPVAGNTPNSLPAAGGPIRGQIGDVITDNTIRIVVHGWSVVTPSQNILPSPGNKLISVDYSIVNIGEEALEVGFFMEVRLEYTIGEVHHYNYVNSNVGFIYQGERFHVSSIIEVPENSNGYLLDFGMWDLVDGSFITNTGLFPFQEVIVDLGNAPSMTDPNVEIPGEIKPPLESMGSPVVCGDWTMQVNHVSAADESQSFPILPAGVLHFILGDITMTNRGADTLSLHYEDFWIQDPTGLRFASYTAEVADIMSSGIEGSYAPGEQKTGDVGFGVPINWSPMWLVFSCGGESSSTESQKVYVSIPVLG